MTRYLLDTNIISNVIQPSPSPSLLAWMARQQNEDLFISSLTVGEVWRGLLEMPTGRRRAELEAWFLGPSGPSALFPKRVLPFDDRAAMVWARLMAEGKAAGRPRDGIDMVIASTAEANGCTIVTDNDRDFQGLAAINPLRA